MSKISLAFLKSPKMLQRLLLLLLFLNSPILSVASSNSSSTCNNFPLEIKIEIENSWGTHKKATVVLKNTQKRHICSAKFKMIFPADSKIFNKWNMKKANDSDEYILPDSWILEDLEERRDTGFVMVGNPPTKIEPISLRFCDSTNEDEIADCSDPTTTNGFSIKIQEKQKWGDKKEIRLIFKNTDKKEICYSRFKLTLAKEAKILTSWNMKKLKPSGDFILPQWAKLKPNEEFKETGFLLTGPLPTVKRIKHRYC